MCSIRNVSLKSCLGRYVLVLIPRKQISKDPLRSDGSVMTVNDVLAAEEVHVCPSQHGAADQETRVSP